MTLPVPLSREMLSPEAWADMTAMAPALAKAYATRQIFRTETEARVSVLDDLHRPTKAAKYWQAVREQCVMLEQLALLSFEWRRNELRIARLQQDGAVDAEERQIDLDECLFRRANMQTVAKDRHREIAMWEMLKGENDDGSFSTDDVNEHQLVSYSVQFIRRGAIAEGKEMTSGERDNLVGQLQTALRRCEQLGVMEKVRPFLSREELSQLQEVGKLTYDHPRD